MMRVDPYAGFAAVYDDWAAHMTEDVGFYVELALEAGGPIVELAVGTGRTATPMAQATGARVTGIDLSPLTLWWVTRSEWEGLVEVSGLETEALYGWFDRRPLDDASRELVWVACKPRTAA